MNNKCVYVHKLNGEVVYVGSGCNHRSIGNASRSKEHLAVWDKLSIEIVSENLSLTESIKLEQELIDKHWPSGKLFNKNKTVHNTKSLNFSELSKFLEYDESSHTFLRWTASPATHIKVGYPAGRITDKGYAQIQFKGKLYYAHRVILVLKHKEDITDGFVVDHIDGDKLNNRISNLRIVSQSTNIRNRPHGKSNTGFQGVSESVNKSFIVRFTDAKQIKYYFSYADNPSVKSKNHYPTRELAFEAAMLFRDMLVDSGKIILTNKEEL